MSSLTKKQIEDFYKSEWSDSLSAGTIETLVELTCKAYKLNGAITVDYIGQKEKPSTHNLGQV